MVTKLESPAWSTVSDGIKASAAKARKRDVCAQLPNSYRISRSLTLIRREEQAASETMFTLAHATERDAHGDVQQEQNGGRDKAAEHRDNEDEPLQRAQERHALFRQHI